MARPPLEKNYFFKRIKRAVSLSLFIFPVVISLFSSLAYAANIEAVLDSTGGASSFVVQDSTGAANPVASIDSAGKMVIKKCLRINGSLAACAQDMSLIVDGNIGVGTVDPGYKLEINGEMNLFSTGSFFRVGGVGILTSDGTNTVLRSNAGQGMTFLPNATEAMRITPAGNVGIGSALPEGKLDVTGGIGRFLSGAAMPNIGHATVPGSVYIQENLEVDGNVYLGDQVTVDNIVVTGTLSLSGSTGYEGPLTITVDNSHALLVRKDSGSQLFNVDTNQGIVSATGNMGVGTTQPAVRLQVGTGSPLHTLAPDSLLVKSDLEVDGNVYLGSASTNTLTVTGLLTLSGDTNYNGPITITTTHANAFLIRNQGGTEIFNVNTGTSELALLGNVGIGTTAPIGRLDVKGGRVLVGTPALGHSTAGGKDLFVEGNISTDASIYGTNTTLTGDLGDAGVTTLGNIQTVANTV